MISRKLNINTDFILSSDLPVNGRRSDYVVNVCRYLNATTYLSPAGSLSYLKEDNFEEKSNIDLIIQNYQSKKYHQNNKVFISHLSIIDVIFNVGLNETMKYIK